MTLFGIGSVGLLLIAIGLTWMVTRFLRAKKIQGAGEERQKEMEQVHDDVLQAKRVEESARLGTDPEWSDRVHDKYRRD